MTSSVVMQNGAVAEFHHRGHSDVNTNYTLKNKEGFHMPQKNHFEFPKGPFSKQFIKRTIFSSNILVARSLFLGMYFHGKRLIF